jgi:hypothetical protein
MSNCAGNWESRRFDDEADPTAPPIEEGYIIVIEPHTGSNDIRGRRRKGSENDDISPGGRCTSGHNGRDLVRFIIREAATGREIIYRGFVEGDRIVEGFWRRKSGPPDPGDSGTWEASKDATNLDKTEARQQYAE